MPTPGATRRSIQAISCAYRGLPRIRATRQPPGRRCQPLRMRCFHSSCCSRRRRYTELASPLPNNRRRDTEIRPIQVRTTSG
ncbi:hypothetical protein [Lysobacter gummosus]|uniref:hypothetical protein n=1 Tax=Lysobacter gummosus TaxID=262324 RepID=UPI003628A0F7